MAKQIVETPEMFDLFEAEEYIEFITDFVSLLRPDIVLERFISETPPNMLIAPKWGGIKNFEFVAKVDKLLKERDIWQGKNYYL